MPWRLLCPVDPDLAKVTNGQRIRDLSNLPPFFYRVQYWGAMTEYWLGEGLVAGSDNLNITDEHFKWYLFEQLRDRIWSDEGGPQETEDTEDNEEPRGSEEAEKSGEGGNADVGTLVVGPQQRYPSPLIAVFSLLEDAKRWAMKQSRRTECNCIITEIDTQKLHTTGVWKFDLDLCRAFGIDPELELVRKYVSGMESDEVGSTYFMFHRLRMYPMKRMFWWGKHPLAPSEHQDVNRIASTLTPNKEEIPVQWFAEWPDDLDEAIADDLEWMDEEEGKRATAHPSLPWTKHTMKIRRYNKHQEELRQVFESKGL